jgi:uncharacterized phiE125 gp8 family phage protein
VLTESWISQFVTVSETEPTYEPVTVNEAKNYFKVDDTTDDALIAQIIKTARKMIETHASLTFHQRTVTQKQTGGVDYIDALRLPANTVSSITFARDFDSTPETLDASSYRLAGNRFYHESREFIQGRDADGYVITYTAGMVADATPSTLKSDLKTAILRVAAFLYENRQEYAQGWSEQGFSVNYDIMKSEINRIVNPYASAKGIF